MSTETAPQASVTMICPNLACRRAVSAPAALRGKLARCTYCNTLFLVPRAPSGDDAGDGDATGRKPT